MHVMERFAYWRFRPMATQIKESEGIREISFLDRGSFIQRVTDRLLALDESLLIKGRWRVLEYHVLDREYWMVRDGWFQLPCMLLWRLSLASCYLWLGIRCAGEVLRGGRRVP